MEKPLVITMVFGCEKQVKLEEVEPEIETFLKEAKEKLKLWIIQDITQRVLSAISFSCLADKKLFLKIVDTIGEYSDDYNFEIRLASLSGSKVNFTVVIADHDWVMAELAGVIEKNKDNAQAVARLIAEKVLDRLNTVIDGLKEVLFEK